MHIGGGCVENDFNILPHIQLLRAFNPRVTCRIAPLTRHGQTLGLLVNTDDASDL